MLACHPYQKGATDPDCDLSELFSDLLRVVAWSSANGYLPQSAALETYFAGWGSSMDYAISDLLVFRRSLSIDPTGISHTPPIFVALI